ncbi:MAG TPA: FAD-dependent oxidoreductase [Bacteroidia bacterium]|jgi:predicted NAD/FAD-binding protein|nr:FAD-dependent oxidoreductase [Bacteroidia bacterium]
MKIAIIGTGIAGMGCGHFLKDNAEIFFYEKNDYPGGHTNTITVDEDACLPDRQGQKVHIDTGFMVFNHVTYPNLLKLFNELKVPTFKTDMSFSVQHVPDKLEYCGSGLNGLFAQRKNIFSLRHIRMLKQIGRFNEESIRILDKPEYADYTLERYIKENKFSDDMLWRYLIPMSAAVWSTPMDKMLEFPVQTLIRFFYNHGFLGLNTQHQWYTVTGGSRTYRDIIMAQFKDKIFLNDPVVKVVRKGNKAVLYTRSGKEAEYDKIIIASHGDEALALLDAPTPDEKRLLSKFHYQKNIATLHTDEAIMPKNKRVWSSWNYRVEEKNGRLEASCIYWMNSLQKVSEKKNYFVSINDPGNVNKSKVIKVIDYTHPLFDVEAAKAQGELRSLNKTGPVYFCGSYFRYGFHEDAFTSAVNLCEHLNKNLTAKDAKNTATLSSQRV